MISFCIPVSDPNADPSRLVDSLLAGAYGTIEIVLAAQPGLVDRFGGLSETWRADPRVRIVHPAPDADLRALWRTTLDGARGDWITLVHPGDMIEPTLDAIATFVEKASPRADAVGWNSFQIDAAADIASADAIAVPTAFDIHTFDKAAMLKAFFYWEGSVEVPKAPFGPYHGLVRRSLLDVMLSIPDQAAWATPVPRYEWTAKTLLCADELVFCARPLSAVDHTPFTPVPAAAGSFPLNAGIGLTAAIAEIQFHVLRNLGSAWGGAEAAFVRACAIDCMKESVADLFEAKCRAYHAALGAIDGALADAFRPQFRGPPARDTRRGLHGNMMFVDRFFGGARTAQDFFGVVRSVIAPVDYIVEVPVSRPANVA